MSGQRRRDFWPLVLFIIAAFLRFSYLSEIEHNVDQAYPIWQALNTLEHGQWPLVGQGTSVLFANPALTGYLYLPFVALTRSPLGAYLLVIALNSLAVPLAYRAVRGLLGHSAALVAALLMAVNPWVIEYSRSTWVQSLLPFFTCAMAWLLWPVLTGQAHKPFRRLLLALITLTLMAQTYLLAYLMIVPVGLLLLIFRRRVQQRALLIGGAVFALATLLYGAGLLAQAEGVSQEVSEFASAPARLSAEAWNHAVRLISGADYPVARGQTTSDWELRQNLTQIAHYGVLALLLVGLVLAASALVRPAIPRTTQGNVRAPAIILLIWFGLPVLLMSYVGQRVHPFYLLLTLPAGYALVGWAVGAIARWMENASGHMVIRPYRLVMALGVPFAVLMIINSQRFAQETAATPGAHDLGALPLDYGIQLGRTITAHLPPGGIVYAEVDEWTLNSLAGTTFPLRRDTRAPQFSIIPQGGGVYVFPFASLPDDWQGPIYTTAHEQIRLPDGVVLTVDAYPADAAQQVAPQHPLNIASEEGLTLIGYDVSDSRTHLDAPLQDSDNSVSLLGTRHSALSTLITYWRVENPAPADWRFTPFAQAYDADGQQIAVVEGVMVTGDEWRVGDVQVHQIALPAGTAAVKLGQFDGPRQRNMIFLPDYTPLIDITLAN